MSPVARPRPDWLDTQVKLQWNGEQRWRSDTGDRLYTYDRLHGHIEVFDKRGRHVGVADILTGQLVGKPVKGRRIDV
ncbi:colicin E3/pyocin S6 family cytotoxin [Nocardia sp. NPDC055053]